MQNTEEKEEILPRETVEEEIIEQNISEEDHVENRDTEILVPDEYFRRVINYELSYSYDDEHHPTKEELSSITSLTISDGEDMSAYIYINDISGLQYMDSLETLEISAAFIPENLFTIAGTLPNLREISFTNTYTSGNVSDVSIEGRRLNGAISDRVPFNPTMNLGALGVSNSIETIYVSSSYLELVGGYQHHLRGILQLEGLGNLSTLKELSISGFAEVDDVNMTFLNGLNSLETVRIIDVPFENADTLNSLENASSIYISYSKINDYSQLNNPAITNTQFSHDMFVTQIQPYTKENNKVYSDYNTGLKIPSDATDVQVSTGNEVELEMYEVVNGELRLKVSADEFSKYTMYNHVTNTRDRVVKGFRYAVSYKLASGVIVDYSLLLAEVGEFITFELMSDNTTYNGKQIQNPINDLGKVEVPTVEDFNISGYMIEQWYYDKEGLQPVDFDQVLNESATYYGKLTKVLNKYTVTFDVDGGTTVEAIEDVEEGSTIEIPVEPKKENHTFAGWYTKPTFETQWDFDVDTVMSDMTLYAKWDVIEDDVKPPIDDKEDPEKPTVPEEGTEDKEEPKKPTVPNEKVDETPKTGMRQNAMQYVSIGMLSLCFLLVLVKKKKSIKK